MRSQPYGDLKEEYSREGTSICKPLSVGSSSVYSKKRKMRDWPSMLAKVGEWEEVRSEMV